MRWSTGFQIHSQPYLLPLCANSNKRHGNENEIRFPSDWVDHLHQASWVFSTFAMVWLNRRPLCQVGIHSGRGAGEIPNPPIPLTQELQASEWHRSQLRDQTREDAIQSCRTRLVLVRHTYSKNICVVYLKFEFNWAWYLIWRLWPNRQVLKPQYSKRSLRWKATKLQPQIASHNQTLPHTGNSVSCMSG